MVQAVIRRDRGFRDSRIIHPTREWFIGLAIMILAVVAGGAYSMLSYVLYDTTAYAPANVTDTLTVYRGVQVESAIELQRAKKEIHQNLIGTPAAALPPVNQVTPPTPGVEIITATTTVSGSSSVTDINNEETDAVDVAIPAL